ncbi:MAG: hypothetical protein P8163_18160 [Candidatus Thiodiazotropha sp.]
MSRLFRKLGKTLSVSTFLLLGAPMLAHAFDIDIQVSPNVLNIQSEGNVVTVHTDISYGSVDVYTVFLNSVPINTWKADDRGNFVAKFLMGEVKLLDGLIIGDYNTLKLIGDTWSGEAFSGEDDIKVLNNLPANGR